MKTVKQLFRQTLKTAAGLILMTLAATALQGHIQAEVK